MPHSPDNNHGDQDMTEWVRQYEDLRQQEAIRWKGHQFDEDGRHDEDECRHCLETRAVVNACKCGKCCHLLIEVDLDDAEREPRIKERGSPIFLPAEATASGQKELVGYFLNTKENDSGCVFLDTATNLCGIYETRPLLCRLFDCDGAGKEQLIELGMIHREAEGA